MRDKDKWKQQMSRELTTLLQNREAYRTVVENMQDGLTLIRNNKVAYVNNAACDIFGYPRDELTKLSTLDLAAPDERGKLQQVKDELNRGDIKTKEVEFWILRKDGARRYIRSRYSPLQDGWFIITTDITDQARTQKALQDSEDKFAKCFNNNPHPMLITDSEDGRIIDVNHSFTRFTGHCREEAIGHTTTELGIWADPHDREKLAKTLWKQESYSDAQINFRMKSGEIRFGLVSSESINLGGKQYSLAVITDITEQKKTTLEMVRQTAITRAINRILTETLACDTEEQLAKASLAVAEELTGSQFGFIGEINKDGRLDTVAISNLGWDACRMPKSEAAALIKNMEIRGIWGQVIKEGKSIIANEPGTYPARAGTPEGHPLLTSFLGVPMYHTGKTIGVIALGNKKDGYDTADQKAVEALSAAITESLLRKRTEETLRHSEEQLKIIIESAEDIIVMYDREGRYLYCNAAPIHNFQPGDFVGKTPFDVFPSEIASQIINHVQQVVASGNGLSTETEVPWKGEKAWFADRLSPVRDKDGNITAVAAISRNITKHKQAEEERRLQEQRTQLASRLSAIGQIAAGVAHEINNPLTSIIGHAHLLLQQNIPKGLREYVQAINDSGQRAARVVGRLLAFARHVKPDRKYINVNDTLRLTIGLKAYQLEATNIKIITDLSPSLPRTMADAGQLQQVFLNLITNAETEMKLAHGKGNLWIKTEKSDNAIHIYFQDDGPGIPPEDLERIFHPFFTTREIGQGAGLGLSICHGIVTEHGGRIYAQSQPGQGAMLIVELPIIAEEKSQPPT